MSITNPTSNTTTANTDTQTERERRDVARNFEREYWRKELNGKLLVEIINANKTALFDALSTTDITHVIVSFDGGGDEGQIYEIEVKSGDDDAELPDIEIEIDDTDTGRDEPEPKRANVTIEEALEHLVYDCLKERFYGWEINEGSYGDFTFDVAARSITLDHNDRFVDSDYSQHVF